MLRRGNKIGIVACSDSYQEKQRSTLFQLEESIKKLELEPVFSTCIIGETFKPTKEEKAKALMDFYKDDEIRVIFDTSGGNLAIEILPFLDYEVIKQNKKPFFGYSDLTTVLNAITTKTGCETYLYQIRNLTYEYKEQQITDFKQTLFEGKQNLFDFNVSWMNKERMEGIVCGGNIRCFLKLACTEYFPDVTGKILFLEAYSGSANLIISMMTQLKLMGVFDKLNGLIIGTFTQMEREHIVPDIKSIVKNVIDDDRLPIAITKQIGHGSDSKALILGKKLILEKSNGILR